ncbi:hypothetical protein NQ315_015083 [Exocentrus adspersus]|uniref:Uncharacterized protein n=1 Tax=Exocentrus adspersus TaxID=1586481 RepID=A0AAV8VWN4_9CUCU|nr:hypothetical protein NQ315_015083 [Exocentrus adspersus]
MGHTHRCMQATSPVVYYTTLKSFKTLKFNLRMVLSTKSKMIWLTFFLSLWTIMYAQEDSLKSALNAIIRRQRDLSDYDEVEYGYPLERPDDLTFLKESAGYNSGHAIDKNGILGKPFINYIDDDNYNSDDLNTQISSAFRERVEEDNQRRLEELARNVFTNGRGSYGIDNQELLREYWEKYRQPYEDTKLYSKFDKLDYYPQIGLDSSGFGKRNPTNHFGNEAFQNIYSNNRQPREEKRYLQTQKKLNMIHQMYSNPYSQIKRYPVAKRSSNYVSLADTHEEKRSVKKQTDPKVQKELSNIFNNKGSTATSTQFPTTTAKLSAIARVQHPRKDDTETNKEVEMKNVNKKELSTLPSVTTKPLLIKKKSIDWSDYFGLDRHNKWLIERYHKSIVIPTQKRTAEVPLSSFFNHEEPPKKDSPENVKENAKEKATFEEKKINDMNGRLKVLEDKIVDDALKFTGAHEGETDPKEIQDVKDRVISRLAEAFSLEKMRNALNEYKLSVAKEKENLKQRNSDEEQYAFSEEKRVAVPRKQVVDDRETAAETDNNIKCSNEDEKCLEQNYRLSDDILDNHFENKCPTIQNACNEVASAIGQYGQLFKSACSMHEMCLLCNDNSWFSPTRQCNTLFLSKAYDLCKGNMECQRAAQLSIPYLLDVNRSLQSQGASLEECELSCPENDIMDNPTDAR